MKLVKIALVAATLAAPFVMPAMAPATGGYEEQHCPNGTWERTFCAFGVDEKGCRPEAYIICKKPRLF